MSKLRGRNTKVTQVGGLRVNYNNWGEIVNMRGNVNRNSNYCNFCGIDSCNANHMHNDRNRYDENDRSYNDRINNNDDNYYYYKQNGKVKKQKKRKKNYKNLLLVLVPM